MTTVFVTHDQEEALEVADEIVVINEGRVEQVGTPDQLYDEPANDFVMSLPRRGHPGSAAVAAAPRHRRGHRPSLAGAIEGNVSRLLRIGFESRLTVLTVDGEEVVGRMTRTEQRSLGLGEGATVWLTPAPGAIVVPSMRASVAV